MKLAMLPCIALGTPVESDLTGPKLLAKIGMVDSISGVNRKHAKVSSPLAEIQDASLSLCFRSGGLPIRELSDAHASL